MARLRPLLGALALSCSLSCSFTEPGKTEIADTFAPALVKLPARSGAHRPDTADWIAARFLTYQTGLSRAEVRGVAEAIVSQAEAHGLEWALILAVIKVESGFHNFARSQVGALGLMQVMPETGEMLARELAIDWRGPETLFDPRVNVEMGTYYLRQLHAKFGSWDRALAAYNFGPGAIDRRLEAGHAVPVHYATAVLAQLPSY